MRTVLTCALGGLLLAGCATTAPDPAACALPSEQASGAVRAWRAPAQGTLPAVRVAAVASSLQRLGAAFGGEGPRHVLEAAPWTPPPPAQAAPEPESEVLALPDAEDILAVPEPLPAPSGTDSTKPMTAKPSVTDRALRQVWERYCRGGEGLTETDWARLEQAGAPEHVPRDLAASCAFPK